MRVMGLDYGDKTVGVAISDELLITAQPIETIERERANKLRKTYQRIEALIAEYSVDKIVIGRPLNMNGTEGERVETTRAFRDELSRRTGLEIVEVDERLTTVEANRILEDFPFGQLLVGYGEIVFELLECDLIRVNVTVV